MASPPTLARTEQPHLVSLVLQSKKALQHGEHLCSRAHSVQNASAQCAIDVLALDAKVRWITDVVLDQLELVATVAKSIEGKRVQLSKQVQEWDDLRVKRTDSLDKILESLDAQLVPPDFHQESDDSSLFGSQHSDDAANANANGHALRTPSPVRFNLSDTLRNDSHSRARRRNADRRKWKSLRDFVDERAIEDALDTMENDRSALDDLLAVTEEYPETLSSMITSIRNSLPAAKAPSSIMDVVNSQGKLSTNMAGHLESLAAHYDQMAGALRESEAGEVFSEEDLQEMNRDTNELPSIMAELEDSVKSIESYHEQLTSDKDAMQKHLDAQHNTLSDLEKLGEFMSTMLSQQQSVETDCDEHLVGLQQHLLTLEDLHERFLNYQTAFNKLLVEIARRRQYREATENIVKTMTSQLRAMTDEERHVREVFNADQGAHLPADICLCIENPPTRWEVVPCPGETLEVLPDIDNDILAEAKDRITTTEGIGTESL